MHRPCIQDNLGVIGKGLVNKVSSLPKWLIKEIVIKWFMFLGGSFFFGGVVNKDFLCMSYSFLSSFPVHFLLGLFISYLLVLCSFCFQSSSER